MVIVATDSINYTNIAEAIRDKNGTETTYKPADMASAIRSLSGGAQDRVWKNTGEHIGFVIGDGYPLSPDLLDSQGGNIDMYRAIGIAYKAIQELNEKIEDLERRIKNEQY